MLQTQSPPFDTSVPLYEPSYEKSIRNRFIAWTQRYIEYRRDLEKSNIRKEVNNNIIKTEFEILNKDERGEIRKIAQNVDVLRIISVKGSKRANHKHLWSSHLCLMVSGAMTYYEKATNQNVKPTKLNIKPGDYFFTDKQIDHLMVFTCDSVFDCYSYGSRDKESYENDLVRLDYDLEELYNNWKD